jgi:hypothetical protein
MGGRMTKREKHELVRFILLVISLMFGGRP